MNVFKWIVQRVGKHAVGTLSGTAVTIVIAGVTYRAYQNSKTGNVQV